MTTNNNANDNINYLYLVKRYARAKGLTLEPTNGTLLGHKVYRLTTRQGVLLIEADLKTIYETNKAFKAHSMRTYRTKSYSFH